MRCLDTSGLSYMPHELNEWLPKIQKLDRVAEKPFVFVNNYRRWQAVSTTCQPRAMLD